MPSNPAYFAKIALDLKFSTIPCISGIVSSWGIAYSSPSDSDSILKGEGPIGY